MEGQIEEELFMDKPNAKKMLIFRIATNVRLCLAVNIYFNDLSYMFADALKTISTNLNWFVLKKNHGNLQKNF